MNGNTETVADVGKTKVSMFGQAMTPGRVSKISKFSRQTWRVTLKVWFFTTFWRFNLSLSKFTDIILVNEINKIDL